MLAARSRNQIGVLYVIVGLALIGVVGPIVAPGAALGWMVLCGIGQRGALGFGQILPVLGGDAAIVASLTAMSLCSALSSRPRGCGCSARCMISLAGWTIALVTLAAICLLELLPGLPAARARTLDA